MEWIRTIFGAMLDLSWVQECARAVLVFAYGLVLVRIAGRRVFGKWSALDIIVSIIVGSNLSRAMTGGAPLWGTLAATTLLMGLHRLTQHLHPGSGRVLVEAAVDGCDSRVEHLARTVGVGETLTEVDTVGGRCELRHLGEDRGAEALEFRGEVWCSLRRHAVQRRSRRPVENRSGTRPPRTH